MEQEEGREMPDGVESKRDIAVFAAKPEWFIH